MNLDAADAIHQEERAFQLGKLARVEWFLGDEHSAARHAEEGARIAEQLHLSDPASMERLYAYASQRFYELSFSSTRFQADDYSELINQIRTLLAIDSPPTSWYALAAQVATGGAHQGDTNAISLGRELLDANTTFSVLQEAEQHHLLDLVVAITQHDSIRGQRVAELTEEAATIFQQSTDFALELPLVRAYRLLGEQNLAGEMGALMTEQGCRHPELLSIEG